MDENPRKKLKMSLCVQLANNLYEQRDETGDVTFIVKSERIRAHRNVLAALSEKYKAQFFGPQPDQGDIQINGVTAAAFKEFLKFFYFDEVDLSIEHIGDVLDLAQQSLVDDFVNKCVEFFKRKITIDNLCSIYQLAITYDIPELKYLCKEKISNNTNALFASDDFVNCDRETLQQILQLDSLNCSEGEVFDACIAWARADCIRNHIDGSKPANLRTALGDAIAHIRFGSMTFEEIAIRYNSHGGFFTPEEYIEIKLIIAKLHGIQSQKFNQSRREPEHGLLECNRAGKKLQPPKENNGYDGISFYCNKPISLHGFAIACDTINKVDVKIKNIDSNGAQFIWPSISIKKMKKETFVLLAEPIYVPPNDLYVICFDSTGLKGCTFRQYYPSGKVESNGISFTFDTSDQISHSLVSRLLFKRL